MSDWEKSYFGGAVELTMNGNCVCCGAGKGGGSGHQMRDYGTHQPSQVPPSPDGLKAYEERDMRPNKEEDIHRRLTLSKGKRRTSMKLSAKMSESRTLTEKFSRFPLNTLYAIRVKAKFRLQKGELRFSVSPLTATVTAGNHHCRRRRNRRRRWIPSTAAGTPFAAVRGYSTASAVVRLDEQGLDVKFGSGRWKVVKKNLVIAKGFKTGSLYLVPVPSGEVTNPVKTNAKIGLANSRVKRVQFTAKNSGTPGNQFEHIRRSEHRRDFRDSGSIESVRTQSGSRRWVQKTRKPNEISPGKLLLVGVFL
ncbi:hypothetical protein E3N88_37141 [Mikania micrantha]|uniref:Uncharacterized protein n=1 Tax=Mikania micrantha TaxID=192012 RepID=A0A5N6M6A9_9ASTR|nr:hypothetical protein E3N88_37141 [Mikania micrantha]